MFSILALLILLFAFGILLVTFVWIARLLARRVETTPLDLKTGDKFEDMRADEASAGVDDLVEETLTPEEQELAELRVKGGAMRTNVTLGLILAGLACLLVSFGPLVLILSVAGLYFCGQALWVGLRYFHMLLLKAVVGLVLGVASVALQYLALTGQLAQVLPFLS